MALAVIYEVLLTSRNLAPKIGGSRISTQVFAGAGRARVSTIVAETCLDAPYVV